MGPLGDSESFDTEPGTHLLPEVDGVRLISNERHELLRRVPAATVDVFETGSTSPGACCILVIFLALPVILLICAWSSTSATRCCDASQLLLWMCLKPGLPRLVRHGLVAPSSHSCCCMLA